VIPKPGKHQIVMPTEPLVHALRRVIVIAAERSRAVKLELGAGTLRLSSNNPDLGEAREELDADYMGEELALAFNARYLLDALSFLGAKEVRLGFQDAVSPAQVAPADDPDSLAVVMPMRL
jgi:DNA polymerase-3 subunit beta